MLIFFGHELPTNKKIFLALTCIYGIGIKLSKKILKKSKVPLYLKPNQLNQDQVINLYSHLITFPLENKLRKIIALNIKQLMELKCFRGWRHYKRLPVRGQRTRTNCKTTRSIKNWF